MADKRARTALLARIEQEPRLAALEKIKCKRDILHWFDWYAYTYDPRNGPNGRPIGVIPFELYDFQREAVLEIYDSIINGRDILIEKSRDMGITWVVVSVFIYCFLFVPDFAGRVGSRNVNEVDKMGDIGTLFEKMRLIYRFTPHFLRPLGFNEARHMTYLRLVNPENRATIVGETANPSFGRSGRNTAALFDEMAFWESGDAAWEACGQTTPCRIAVSTPNGSSNRFGKMANRKIPDQPKKLTYHWKQHPKHDDAWYEFQKTRYTKSGLAREVDISYTLSLEGKVFEMFEYGLHVKQVSIKPNTYNPHKLWTPDPNIPITIAFDFGRVCAALFSQIDDYYNIDVFHEIVLDGEQGRPKGSTEELAIAVLAWMDKYNAIHPYRDPRNPQLAAYSYQYTGDPAGATKPWQQNEAFSDHDILSQRGIYPLQVDKVIRAKNRLQSGISLLQTIFNTRHNGRERLYIHNPDKCPTLIAALQGEYRYKSDRNGDTTETIDEKHPYEDVVDDLRYTVLQFADILPDIGDMPNSGKNVVESPYVFPV